MAIKKLGRPPANTVTGTENSHSENIDIDAVDMRLKTPARTNGTRSCEPPSQAYTAIIESRVVLPADRMNEIAEKIPPAIASSVLRISLVQDVGHDKTDLQGKLRLPGFAPPSPGRPSSSHHAFSRINRSCIGRSSESSLTSPRGSRTSKMKGSPSTPASQIQWVIADAPTRAGHEVNSGEHDGLTLNPSRQVASVKEKIQAEKGWEPTSIKLIYSGKILQDAQTVGSYNIDEKGFVVCMVSKPKPTSAKPSGSSSAAGPSTPVKSSTPVQTPAAPIPNPPTASTGATVVPETPTPAPPAAAAQPAAASFNDPSSLAIGSARESAIQQMMEMGFPRPDVEAAMRAAFNNPDRAVEYLMTGIPENLQREATPAQSSRPPAPAAAAAPSANPPAQQQAPAAAESDEPINLFDAAAAQRQGNRANPGGRGAQVAAAFGGGAGAAGGAATANLDFLRNNPQFQQLRQVVQEHPQMLEPILQQVGQGNPQLAHLISQNPGAFLQILSEGADGEGDLADMLGAAGGAGAGGGATMSIPVTEEERDAIERLCQLGFERDLVIQAYFACDKNEEMAANFLFEQPPDPEN
ncbi:UV excision repair protein [Drechslerella dactyloides]|uniref:UV excision repair protein n=1 Tax=Drechslerella dactyloides TaxID=74499 RepID=A0AAD6J488_DREDA|nr:UV excision repair protein [Drechslerella dactyloides]